MTDTIESVDRLTPPPTDERVHRVDPTTADQRGKQSPDKRCGQHDTKQDEETKREIKDIVEIQDHEVEVADDNNKSQPKNEDSRDEDESQDDDSQHVDFKA